VRGSKPVLFLYRTFGVCLLALGLIGPAFAQQAVPSPRSIVVNPQPAFELQVWLDKDPRSLCAYLIVWVRGSRGAESPLHPNVGAVGVVESLY
jgi:hypothetical protein